MIAKGSKKDPNILDFSESDTISAMKYDPKIDRFGFAGVGGTWLLALLLSAEILVLRWGLQKVSERLERLGETPDFGTVSFGLE